MFTIARVAGRLEMRRGGPAHLVIADQVDRVVALELVGVEQVEALVRDRLGDGGVVDEHIEPPPCVDRRLHQRAAVVVLRDVALDGEGLDARRLAVRHDLVGARLVGRVVHHDVAAARREELRAFAADAVRRSSIR